MKCGENFLNDIDLESYAAVLFDRFLAASATLETTDFNISAKFKNSLKFILDLDVLSEDLEIALTVLSAEVKADNYQKFMDSLYQLNDFCAEFGIYTLDLLQLIDCINDLESFIPEYSEDLQDDLDRIEKINANIETVELIFVMMSELVQHKLVDFEKIAKILEINPCSDFTKEYMTALLDNNTNNFMMKFFDDLYNELKPNIQSYFSNMFYDKRSFSPRELTELIIVLLNISIKVMQDNEPPAYSKILKSLPMNYDLKDDQLKLSLNEFLCIDFAVVENLQFMVLVSVEQHAREKQALLESYKKPTDSSSQKVANPQSRLLLSV